jgi:hypothetical protein
MRSDNLGAWRAWRERIGMLSLPALPALPRPSRLWTAVTARDSYGVILVLVIAYYAASSSVPDSSWQRVLLVALEGVVLMLTLHASRAHPLAVLLACVFLVGGVFFALLDVALRADVFHTPSPLVGLLLLIVAPIIIARRIATHRIVSVETILGATCVYVLAGMCFALIYSTIDSFNSGPFFAGYKGNASTSDYLFFSFTTLTTVGYGNLIPIDSLGKTVAVLEALFGQIYLVIIVARLVALWGQERHRTHTQAIASAPDNTTIHATNTSEHAATHAPQQIRRERQ